MKTKILLLLILSTFLSCSSDDDNNPPEINCTLNFVYGLNITLKDANTNAIITQNVTVIAVDGNYEETLENMAGEDSFVGAGERPGNYVLTVTSNNYQTFTSNSIELKKDLCHVIPKSFEFILTPN